MCVTFQSFKVSQGQISDEQNREDLSFKQEHAFLLVSSVLSLKPDVLLYFLDGKILKELHSFVNIS
jgi:hypothetical protein